MAVQSAPSTKGAADGKTSAEGEAAGADGGDFARALLAGLQTGDGKKKQLSDGLTDSQLAALQELSIKSSEKPSENSSENSSEKSSKDGSGKLLQRLEFDDELVGEPVQAPILEVLQAMQQLLPKTSQSGESGPADGAAESELTAAATEKVEDVLAALKLTELSSQQRQNFADEYVENLSAEQRQQLLDMDISQASQVIEDIAQQVQLAVTDAKPADAKSAADIDPASVEWLARQLEKLPEQASGATEVQQLQKQIEQFRQLLPGAGADADANTNTEEKPALVNQLQQMIDQLPQSELKAELSKQLEQLQQVQPLKPGQEAVPRTLTTEQQQQIQQVIDQLPKAESSAELSKQLEQLQQVQPSPHGQTVRSEVTASQSVQGQVTIPRTLNTEQQQQVQQVVDELPDSDLKTQLKSSLLAEQGVKLGEQLSSENKTSAASFIEPTSSLVQARNEADAMPGLHQQSALPNSTVKAGETSSTAQSLMQAIQKPFDPQQSEASQKLQERINIMLSKNIQRADIRIDPPELGQLQVRVNMNSEQASVQFQVQSQQAREVIENAMPRLREMLEQQGVALADTDVREQQQDGSAEQQQQSADDSRTDEEQQYQIAVENGKPIALGSVDFYV
ncbi:MAG: flagellar hook-length control protein FliK [Pseudomonadota bacterium]